MQKKSIFINNQNIGSLNNSILASSRFLTINWGFYVVVLPWSLIKWRIFIRILFGNIVHFSIALQIVTFLPTIVTAIVVALSRSARR